MRAADITGRRAVIVAPIVDRDAVGGERPVAIGTIRERREFAPGWTGIVLATDGGDELVAYWHELRLLEGRR